MTKQIRYFESSAALRAWLRRNYARATELRIGFFKRHTGKPSITWAEAVAEALCFGWIDGVRNRINNDSYVIRFTPRKTGSTWSATNIRTVKELESSGRMTETGRAAFAARVGAKSKQYSYEQDEVRLDPTRLRKFRSKKAAWEFFSSQAPSYQRKAIWWIMSAKQEDAKDRRFTRLLAASVARKRMG